MTMQHPCDFSSDSEETGEPGCALSGAVSSFLSTSTFTSAGFAVLAASASASAFWAGSGSAAAFSSSAGSGSAAGAFSGSGAF